MSNSGRSAGDKARQVIFALIALLAVAGGRCAGARSAGDDAIRAADNLIGSADDAIRARPVNRPAVEAARRTIDGTPEARAFDNALEQMAGEVAVPEDSGWFLLHDVACAVLDYHLEHGGSPQEEDVATFMLEEAVERGLGNSPAQKAQEIVALVENVQTLPEASLVAFVIVECHLSE